MDQAVLVHADVDERAERRDVGDQALEDHAFLDVLEGHHVVAEPRRLEQRARIAPRAQQLGEDVAHGGVTDLAVDVTAAIDRLDHRGVAEQRHHLDAEIGGDALDQRVALGVDRRGVERLRAGPHPQEPGALLEGLGPEARHFAQLGAGGEAAALVAIRDDLLGQRRADARDVAEQARARGVEIDADVIDAALDHVAQLLAEQRRVHVVLVLPDADGLGLDLHQLGQRILEPPRDRDRAADREIEIRELVARQIRRAVHAGSGLVDRDHHALAESGGRQQAPHEHLGLATAGAVADRDRHRVMGAHELGELGLGALERGLALGEEDRHRAEVAAGGVDGGALAAGAQAGVDADHALGAQRRLQQQRPQVAGEHARGLEVRRGLALGAHVVLDRRRQEPAVALADRARELLAPRRGRAMPEQPHQRRDDAVGAAVGLDRRAQHALGLAAADRQEAVRRDGGHRLAERVVRLVLGRLGDLVGDAGRDHRAGAERRAHQRAHIGAIAHHLGDDVAGAGQRVVDRRHLALHEGRGLDRGLAVVGLGEHALGQGRQAALARRHRPGPAPRTVRRVEILEGLLGGGGGQRRGQGVGERAGGGQLGEDRRAPGLALGQVDVALLDGAQLHLVEPARLLLAVARDERNRRPIGEQRDRRSHAGGRQAQLGGDLGDRIVGGGGGHGEGAHASPQSGAGQPQPARDPLTASESATHRAGGSAGPRPWRWCAGCRRTAAR